MDKIRKNINPKNFLKNAKQEFPSQSLKVSLKNTTTWEIKTWTSNLNLCVPKKTHPNYSVGSDQDEAEIQYDQ